MAQVIVELASASIKAVRVCLQALNSDTNLPFALRDSARVL